MASINLIYGSTGGNTEMVVDRVTALLKEAGHKPAMQRVELSKPEDMLKADVAILACPTYGQGILQEDFEPFYQALKGFELKGHPCAVIGLGDPKYQLQYHLESANTLESAIQESGGTLLLPAMRISRSPVVFLHSLVPKWTEMLIEKLNTL